MSAARLKIFVIVEKPPRPQACIAGFGARFACLFNKHEEGENMRQLSISNHVTPGARPFSPECRALATSSGRSIRNMSYAQFVGSS